MDLKCIFTAEWKHLMQASGKNACLKLQLFPAGEMAYLEN